MNEGDKTMYAYFISQTAIVALIGLVLVKYLPRLLRFTRINEQAITVAQGVMIAYGIIIGILMPTVVLGLYFSHYILPF